MTLRRKIATMIAPELEDAEESAAFWEQANENNIQWRYRVMRERDAYRVALRNIIALKTPGCAHVGKRMADLAEQALKSGEAK